MQNKQEYLIKTFQNAGISLSMDQADAFLQYAVLLEEWNQNINLTAITEFEEVVQKHFLDSVYPFTLLKAKTDITLLDVGSGAGFPGIPLKILFPKLQISLLDSLNKRIRFLNEVIGQLHLTKIQAIHGRAEDFAKQMDYREQFDLVTARAVAPMRILAEYCLPFVRLGGFFWAYKAENVAEEVELAEKAISILGGEGPESLHYTLPESEAGRSLIQYQKTDLSPASYPRKAGTIAKKPL